MESLESPAVDKRSALGASAGPGKHVSVADHAGVATDQHLAAITHFATTPQKAGDAELGWKNDVWSAFPAALWGFGLGIFVLFCVFVRFDHESQTDEHVRQYYMFYVHVSIMIFVGFGFLMTFLRRYSYSAVGLNFVTSCLVLLEAIVMIGFAQQQFWGGVESYIIKLDLPLMIEGLFCAASSMISFGAVLGKVSPVQLVWLLVLQVPVYAANQSLIMRTMGVLDIGGSITIHVFGAYYGLAASMILSKAGTGATHCRNRTSYTSDVTSMIGTLFLWIYWPSFNAALASIRADGPEGAAKSPLQFNCVVNTALSLCGACIAAFAMSSAVSGKLDMMHIQNATLAGGVAMGSAANLGVAPGFAVGVGLCAGTLSTLGFTHIMLWLEDRIGLTDTCGVHNLHGMPGLFAALVAAVASAWSFPSYGTHMPEGRRQPGHEVAGALVSLGVALAWGTIVGFFVDRVVGRGVKVDQAFDDGVFWHGVGEDVPRSVHANVVHHYYTHMDKPSGSAAAHQHQHEDRV